jgi:hypothetical protein
LSCAQMVLRPAAAPGGSELVGVSRSNRERNKVEL